MNKILRGILDRIFSTAGVVLSAFLLLTMMVVNEKTERDAKNQHEVDLKKIAELERAERINNSRIKLWKIREEEASHSAFALTAVLTNTVNNRGLDHLSDAEDGMVYDPEHQQLVVTSGLGPIGHGYDDLRFWVKVDDGNVTLKQIMPDIPERNSSEW